MVRTWEFRVKEPEAQSQFHSDSTSRFQPLALGRRLAL